MLHWAELLAMAERVSADDLARRQRQQEFDDPINIQYTSGTTGYPKGATLSHHNILNNGYFTAELLRFTDRDRLLIPVPLYHCFGMVMGNLGCMTHGATMIYPSDGFDADGRAGGRAGRARHRALRRADDVHRRAEPSRLRALRSVAALRTGIMAGSPCPVEVMKQVQTLMHMHEVAIAYGMTETSPVSTQTRIGAPLDKQVGTVGPGAPARARSRSSIRQTGQVVPVGERGELCTRGYSVMLGYWDNEEATRTSIDAARWMHTGDLAVMDDEGYLNIVGRIKDMIIRGGENVYPREIEEFLYSHPKIQDVQVIGVPDEKYGEEIMAWVQAARGAGDHRGRDPRLLPRQDRPLQDPALRQVRRRVPHDGDRQGAEVPDARGEREGARPGEGRRREDGLTPLARQGQRGGASRHSPSVRISSSAFDVRTTPGRIR